MFKTALPLTPNPERTTRTAFAVRTRPERRQGLWGKADSMRPMTSPVVELRNYSTLNSTGRSTQMVDMRGVEAVESELEEEFKGEMCGYLRGKLRRMVGRRQEEVAVDRYLHSTIDNHEMQSTGRSSLGPLDQLYSTFRHPSGVRVEKAVDGAYLHNVKERIARLIERKKENESRFVDLRSTISSRRKYASENRVKVVREQFLVPSVEKEEWHKEWLQDVAKEGRRYRNRLFIKCHRETRSINIDIAN